MSLFPLKKKGFFSSEENTRVVEAIRQAERTTSGEIRVFIENRCRFVDPLDRVEEIFWGLKMDHTAYHNSVLIYVALKDHQFAIYADDGIHKKLGKEFWDNEIQEMIRHFRRHHYVDALVEVIKDIGNALHYHFPFDPAADKNELPDDIVFGR